MGSLTSVGGRVFFRADDGVHGSELWVSDGTPAGTELVADVNMGGGFAVSPKGRADTTAGTLRVKVTVPGAGTLDVAPAAGSPIKRSRLEVGRADVVPVTLRPTASGLRQLRKTGELQVRARFTFTPCGGAGSSVVGRYTLRLR